MLVGATLADMDLLQSLAELAGRLMKPLRSGERHLAAQHLRLVGVERIDVTSAAFRDGARIPGAYAGSDGRSPPLRFEPLPDGTREVVVLCEDPDAPLPRPFVHWIVFGLPATARELPEGLPPSDAPLGTGAQQGRNTLRKDGYVGPTPPPGHGVHHYHFQVFALDMRLDVRAPVDRGRLVDAMKGHVIGFGELIGTYEAR
jgi:Raf kinase inhibitor-like YbhB/YbcL family protein